MAQNIYDQAEFFAGYSSLERSVRGLDGAPEWPLLRAMLPPLAGLDVVDLGCGFGWFCRWAREQAAGTVLGLDLSENMLARARSMTGDAAVRYERTDLETLALPAAAFDVAYSSLVLHYLEDLDRVLAMVRRALRSGGAFVFSMEHPIYTAPLHPSWIEGAGTDWVWPLHAYAEEGPRRTDWLAKDVLKYHRTSGSVLNALIRNDFVIDAVHDFCPSVADIETYPDWRRDRQRPIFLLIGTHSGGT